MCTWEPTAIVLGASTSTPDVLMLSTWPWIIFLLGSLSSPCDTLTGQQTEMRSESLASPVPIGFVAATSSCCRLVQERLILKGSGCLGDEFAATQLSLGSRLRFNRAKSRTYGLSGRLTLRTTERTQRIGREGR